MTQATLSHDVHREHFDALVSRLGGGGWFHAARQEAFDRFAARGFPTTKHEDWRYTNLAPWAALPYRWGGSGEVDARTVDGLCLPDVVGPSLVFVDGAFRADLSRKTDLPTGVVVGSLAPALAERRRQLEPWLGRIADTQDQPLNALSTALIEDGALVHVRAGLELDEPIQLLFLASAADGPAISHPRVLVVLESGARATVVERHSTPDGADSARLANAVTEIALGESARLEHVRLAGTGGRNALLSTVAARVERNAALEARTLLLGGGLVRADAAAHLAAPGADVALDGLYVAGGRGHVDCRTFVDHAAPHCDSRQLYKGILGGAARGVFNGKVLVRTDAQATNARQSNRNLLLSDEALADTRPQLEIHADDVKCTHGATVGRLDPESLFYLRSRGIGAGQARRMLTRAFGAEVIEGVRHDAVRAALDRVLGETVPLEGEA